MGKTPNSIKPLCFDILMYPNAECLGTHMVVSIEVPSDSKMTDIKKRCQEITRAEGYKAFSIVFNNGVRTSPIPV